MKARFALLAVLMLFAVNALAIKVVYDYDRSFDFGKAKTYQWVDLKEGQANQLTDQKIKQAINEDLAKKGLTRVEANPDLYLAYEVGIKQEQQIYTTTTGGWGWDPWWGAGMASATSTSSTINIGTLVINFVNAQNRKLVFRSSGTDTINPSKDPDKNFKKIQSAVQKILKDFPPKPKK